MSVENVRLNITIPKHLLTTLDHLAGPRKRSRFIVDAVSRKIAEEDKLNLEAQLRDGYQARRKENLELVDEFESADLENWDEY
jgi:metal-responsive CopG/Arc/MetJ family transcriptional regulator